MNACMLVHTYTDVHSTHKVSLPYCAWNNSQHNSGMMAAVCLDCLAKQSELGFSNILEKITSLVVLLGPAKCQQHGCCTVTCKTTRQRHKHVIFILPGKRARACLVQQDQQNSRCMAFITCSDKWRERGCSAMLAKGPQQGYFDLLGLMAQAFLL